MCAVVCDCVRIYSYLCVSEEVRINMGSESERREAGQRIS